MSLSGQIQPSAASLSRYRYPAHHSWDELACWQKGTQQPKLSSDIHPHALKQMSGASAHATYPAIPFSYWTAQSFHFFWLSCLDILIRCSAERLDTAHDKHSCGRGGNVECVQILQSCELPLFLCENFSMTFFSRRSVSLEEQPSGGKTTQKEPLRRIPLWRQTEGPSLDNPSFQNIQSCI